MEILRSKEMVAAKKTEMADFCAKVKKEGKKPYLRIIRDNQDQVIEKYVAMKRRFGEEIGVEVEDVVVEGADGIRRAILEANEAPEVTGMILQLPIAEKEKTQEKLCHLGDYI